MATNTKKPTDGKEEPVEVKKTVYIVTSPLSHDMVEYAVDDEVSLTDTEAAVLLGYAVKPTSTD